MEMDMEWKWSGNGAQFVKIVWIGLDLGQSADLKPYDRHQTFTKHDKRKPVPENLFRATTLHIGRYRRE